MQNAKASGGKEFEDELSGNLKHDRRRLWRALDLGRMDAGFFYHTTATPWLDKMHTIFRRAIAGLGVMHTIENAKANKTDKLFEDIKIINIDIQ